MPGGDGAGLIKGRYEPLAVAGRGGQGEVVRALDHQHDRIVALKIRQTDPAVDREAILRESRVLLSLRPHQSLPLVRDDFFDGDRHVMVMDWVEGENLSSLARRRDPAVLPPTLVVEALAEVAAALDHLHTHDPPMVHQDVKPANMIRTPEGRVVLVDFGVSSTGGSPSSAGTMGFRAPELAAGSEVTSAVDVFGLAASAFVLLTGTKPGPASGAGWERLPAAGVIERAIRRALSTDPQRRHPSASALIEDLRTWLDQTMPSGTITLLLTDVSGSTSAWEEYPGAMARALERHDELMAETVARHGGSLVKQRSEGDSAFAVFSHAADAVRCADAIQRRFARERWPTPTPLRVRIAVHTGQAQRREHDYFGPVVNRCTRLRAIAHGGQTVLSGATAELIDGELPEDCRLIDHGHHRLRDLTQAEHVFELAAIGSEAFPPLRSLDRHRHNLPVRLTSFVGRGADLARLGELLDVTRLVTLTGIGGVGKTRLALQFAADLGAEADGDVFMVELAAVGDPGLVLGEVLRAAGERATTTAPEDAVVRALSGRPVLLVVDNCEHVIDEAARLTDLLLRSCPDLRIVATSREPLSVPGEAIMAVEPLAAPDPQTEPSLTEVLATDAGALFAERALLAGTDVEPGHASTIAGIVTRLDGIPLAVELAAAASATRPLAEVLSGLDDRFALLTGGARTVLPRQRTLRAAIEWSHDLLSEDERTVFRRLAAFTGRFDVDDARAVCDSDGAAEQVRALAGKSLLTVDEDGRFAMLESPRAYAEEQLEAAGEREETLRRVRGDEERHAHAIVDHADPAEA